MAITEEKLIEILEEHRKLISNEFKEQIEHLKCELKDTQNTLNITHKIAIDNENEVKLLKVEIDSLKKSQEVLVNQIDDVTNRNMRNTLIFRGVMEEPNENWGVTEQILVNLLITQVDVPPESATNMIERAHRGKNNNNKTLRAEELHVIIKKENRNTTKN